MGMFNYLHFDDGVEVPENLPNEGWQTKNLKPNIMRSYRVTEDGKLLEEEYHTEEVPREERPMYDEEIDGFESSLHEFAGSMRHVTDGWTEKGYHGIIRAIGPRPEYTEIEIKFTDGRLEDIEVVEE